MVTDASKDPLAHPANDTRRVPHRLVHAELDVVRTEEECLPTEQRRACLRSNPRARTTLREEQRNGLEEERLRRQPHLLGAFGRGDVLQPRL